MPIEIRRALVADAEALTSVQIASWRTTYRGIVSDAFLSDLENVIRVEKWAERLASPGFLALIAEEVADNPSEPKRTVIGFLNGGSLREPVEDFDGELYAIYLLLSAHRKGIGRALTMRLAELLHAQGLKSMLVWVLTDNPAVDFYRKMGATRITEKRITIGNEELMETALGWKTLDALLVTRPRP